MPTNLTTQDIDTTFQQILHVDGGVTSTPKTVYDGDGTATGLQISTTGITVGDVSETELQYLNGVTGPIQTQLDAKQATLSKLALTSLTPANLVWTGTTAPSGATNHLHSFVNIGGYVTGFFRLDYASAGTALTQVEFDLPSGWPTPDVGALSLGADGRFLGDTGILSSSYTSNGSQARVFLKRNAANNGWSILSNASSGSHRIAMGYVRYWAA